MFFLSLISKFFYRDFINPDGGIKTMQEEERIPTAVMEGIKEGCLEKEREKTVIGGTR